MCRKVIWDQVVKVGVRPSSGNRCLLADGEGGGDDCSWGKGGESTFVPPALPNT